MPRPLNSSASASSGVRSPSKKSKIPQNWLKILKWGLYLTGAYFCYLNVQPYEQAVRFLSGKVVNSAFVFLVSVIPVVNGIAFYLGRGITWILGCILWGVIQIIEVLPLILYNDEEFMQRLITEADGRKNFQIKETDEPVLTMLKRTHNALPVSVVSNLERLKIITYTVDFLICITVYSPVQDGNFKDFFWVLASGQWQKLDYGNLALALATLFAVEIILSLIIWVGKLSNSLNPPVER
jgi:hypothetical protein